MLVGIDVVNIERFEKLIENDNFFSKYFTDYEKKYVFTRPKPAETLAGLYSAKEAFLKALGIGIGRGIDLKDIHICHNELGKPYYDINQDNMIENLKKYNIQQVELSISHTNKVSTAICVIF
ncbi:MAG: holo-ACP synthase [Christensenellales bacterium]